MLVWVCAYEWVVLVTVVILGENICKATVENKINQDTIFTGFGQK